MSFWLHSKAYQYQGAENRGRELKSLGQRETSFQFPNESHSIPKLSPPIREVFGKQNQTKPCPTSSTFCNFLAKPSKAAFIKVPIQVGEDS